MERFLSIILLVAVVIALTLVLLRSRKNASQSEQKIGTSITFARQSDADAADPIGIEPAELHNSNVCPQCGAPVTVKLARKGSNKGKEIVACSTFPQCRYIVS